jgi:hypothetical protein
LGKSKGWGQDENPVPKHTTSIELSQDAYEIYSKWSTDMICLIDTKAENLDKLGTYSTSYERWAQKIGGSHSKPKWCTVSARTAKKGVVGGISSVCQGALAARICEKYTDKWGRWVSVTIQGKDLRKLTVITVYGPTPTQSSGSQYQQQVTLIEEELSTQGNAKPKEHFKVDLAKFANEAILGGLP